MTDFVFGRDECFPFTTASVPRCNKLLSSGIALSRHVQVWQYSTVFIL